MKKINLCEVCTDTNIGGAGKCLLTLLANLDMDIFNLSVVLPLNSALTPLIHDMNTNIRITEVEGLGEKSLSLDMIGMFRHHFKSEHTDIVHTHACMSARIAAKRTGVKAVYTRHSVFEPSKKISRGIGKLINGMVNNHYADAIIAVAEAAKDNLIATGVSEKKIKVILNGVEGLSSVSSDERRIIKERFSLPDGYKAVSIVARLEDIKGHEYFIDAADMLLRDGVKARFYIAGTGSYKQQLREKVKKMHREEQIIFTGFISDIDKLMNITDIQVNASYGTEATSLALLEGMSIGIPAVVSDFGGNPGVIHDGENGFVVPKQNAAAIAEKLKKLLDDENLYKEMSENSKRIFNESFTAEAMTKKTEQVYLSLINR